MADTVNIDEGFEQAVDQLMAKLTLPTEPAPRRVRLASGAPEPAVDRDTWELHVRYARHRRPRDRELLTERYLGQARNLARRFYRNWEPLEDLEQVALEGLMLALDRFDPRRGMPFLGYANPTIIGCLKRFYRDSGWGVRVPRRVHELSRPMRDAWEQLAQDFGRAPTSAELADLLDVSEADVDAALGAESARTTGSLDAPLGDDGSTTGERTGAVDPGLDLVENRYAVEQVLVLLADEDRELLGLYFEEGRTQSEIAEILGVSQMQISRSLNRILRQLRSHMPAG